MFVICFAHSEDALARRFHRAVAVLEGPAAARSPPLASLREQYEDLLTCVQQEMATTMLLRDALSSAASFIAKHERLPRRGRLALEPGEVVLQGLLKCAVVASRWTSGRQIEGPRLVV